VVVGVDIDGVISLGFLGLHRALRHFPVLWNKLIDLSIGKLLYSHLRRVNKEMRDVLFQIHFAGHKIVIISYVCERHRGEVTGWLWENKIPFDKLVLPRDGETVCKFKVRAIKEKKCVLYVEDDPAIVKRIRPVLNSCTVFHYHPGDEKALLFLVSEDN